MLTPLILIFAVFLLIRGHNQPGGGFVGGLTAATAYVLYAIAFGVQQARAALKIEPIMLIGLGLLIAVLSGFVGPLFGFPFMTGGWYDVTLPVLGKAGTPVLFDVGVFLLVVGMSLTMIFNLMETE